MKRPSTNHDLPTSRMPGDFYIVQKAHDPAEIARRQAMVPGELKLELQPRGLAIGRRVLERVTEQPSIKFAAKIVAASCINTAWYTYAQQEHLNPEGVRRRMLKYARITEYPDGDALLEGAIAKAKVAERLGTDLRQEHHRGGQRIDRFQRDFGRAVGETGLMLAVAAETVGQALPSGLYDGQLLAREHGISLMDSRQQYADIIGTAPSVVQLAEPDSDVSIFWRRDRSVPEEARQVFIEQQQTVLAAAA